MQSKRQSHVCMIVSIEREMNISAEENKRHRNEVKHHLKFNRLQTNLKIYMFPHVIRA